MLAQPPQVPQLRAVLPRLFPASVSSPLLTTQTTSSVSSSRCLRPPAVHPRIPLSPSTASLAAMVTPRCRPKAPSPTSRLTPTSSPPSTTSPTGNKDLRSDLIHTTGRTMGSGHAGGNMSSPLSRTLCRSTASSYRSPKPLRAARACLRSAQAYTSSHIPSMAPSRPVLLTHH